MTSRKIIAWWLFASARYAKQTVKVQCGVKKKGSGSFDGGLIVFPQRFRYMFCDKLWNTKSVECTGVKLLNVINMSKHTSRKGYGEQ